MLELGNQTATALNNNVNGPQVTVPLPEIKSSKLEGNQQLVLRQHPSDMNTDGRSGDFIPDELLAVLTVHPQPSEQLGPQHLLGKNTSKKPPANAWNFSKQRDKLKHLTEGIPCVCGAGRDISFLYDVPKPMEEIDVEKDVADKYDRSKVRKPKSEDKKMALPDSLIPEEYHIVKNQGVLGLEYIPECKDSSALAEDHRKHMVVFPSLKPTSRFEVSQLKKTFKSMIDKLGIDDLEREVRGPTQLHNLIELIRKEQNVYNVIFHEIIRQVTVECAERGELLSEVRQKYADILSRIPRQIRSLHDEVLAQRALDRRLTEELLKFRVAIANLTNELAVVRDHDTQMTEECRSTQDQLKRALAESEKNANLLGEYHELYELQRSRLESQVLQLNDEKEIWSNTAYSLALKVTLENRLTTAKRLHLAEKAWHKLASHFAVRLADKDTEGLTRMAEHIDKWRLLLTGFDTAQQEIETLLLRKIDQVVGGIEAVLRQLASHMVDQRITTSPTVDETLEIASRIKRWEELVTFEAERYSGDEQVTRTEDLAKVRRQMHAWSSCVEKVFSRHRPEQGLLPQHAAMRDVNETVEILLKQYAVRMNGENGVARRLLYLMTALEQWYAVLSACKHSQTPLPETQWTRFVNILEDWSVLLQQTRDAVGVIYSEDVTLLQGDQPPDKFEVINIVQKWMGGTTNEIDGEDSKLVQQTTTIHTAMVRWMVQLLIHLAPSKFPVSAEAEQLALLSAAPPEKLVGQARKLFVQLETFSGYLTSCCMDMIKEEMMELLKQHVDHAEQEFKDLQRVSEECQNWVDTAAALMKGLVGEKTWNAPTSSMQGSSGMTTSMGASAQLGRWDSRGAAGEHPALAEGTEPEQATELGNEAGEKPDEDGPSADPSSGEVGETGADAGSSGNGKRSDTGALKKEVSFAEMPDDDDVNREGTELSLARDDTLDIASNDAGSSLGGRSKSQSRIDDGVDKVEYIGHDDNIHSQMLDQRPDTAPIQRQGHKHAADEVVATAPDARRAFEALAAVQSLQQQLLSAEERAQKSELKNKRLSANLDDALEQVRMLERQIADHQAEKSQETTAKSARSMDTARPPGMAGISSTMKKVEKPPVQAKTPEPKSAKGGKNIARKSTKK